MDVTPFFLLPLCHADGRVCLLDPATAQNVLIKFAKAALSPEQVRG